MLSSRCASACARSTLDLTWSTYAIRCLPSYRPRMTLTNNDHPPQAKRRRLSTTTKQTTTNMRPHNRPVSLKSVITLTPLEETLRRLFVDVAASIDDGESKSVTATSPTLDSTEPVQLRITGGWVRDKLLGADSHDIDIGINRLTGLGFAEALKAYLEVPGNREKYGLNEEPTLKIESDSQAVIDSSSTIPPPKDRKKVGTLHKIEANPDKSKHLETVMIRILGADIDLVNLRRETYTDDSRNPQMQFGTAKEDALRRDATVNALFYNLHSNQVEDYTGHGIDDLRSGLIRTPLEPYQTFKDDPLRVLRLIRFASRLGFDLDPAAELAMSEPNIKDALELKISRERVGVEIDKMLRGI
jgi:tRNA nucleotidyltransferase (CCA-adding enzyme)